MEQQKFDPRMPFIIGIVALTGLLIVGIIVAVFFLPEDTGTGRTDYNVSFHDEGDPVFGPDNAKVIVRLFEDFQCPACKSAKAGVSYAMETFGDRVKFIWNDFPLQSIHRNARRAANAARCAEAQGKFWEYHDLLYDYQSNWDDLPNPNEELGRIADRAGLNVRAFDDCLSKNQYDDKVLADIDEGNANRVDSTPTFFIGKKRITGGMSPDDWDRELNAALKVVTSEVPDAMMVTSTQPAE